MSSDQQAPRDDDFAQMLGRVRAASGTEPEKPRRTGVPKKKKSSSAPIWAALIGPAVIVAVTLAGLFGLIRIGVWSTTRIVAQGAGLGAGMQRKRQLQQRHLERWRVAVDTTITALAAGQMLHELYRAGYDSSLFLWERPIELSLAEPECCDQFQRAASRKFDAKTDWGVAAFAAARRGFNAEQRRFLTEVSRSAPLAEFRRLSHARDADVAAGLWDVPADVTISWTELPSMRWAPIRSMAGANVASAALDLEAGRVALAEQRLREVISIGFLIQRGARTTIEETYGSLLVNVGRGSLEALFMAVGRTQDATLVSTKSDPQIPTTIGNSFRVSASELHNSLRQRILDTTELTGTRWQMLLGPFAYLPCTSVRQMIFGPSSQHRAALEEFRAALVKYPSDERRLSMTVRTMAQLIDPASRWRPNDTERPAWASAVSSVTRNRQLEMCASLFRR